MHNLTLCKVTKPPSTDCTALTWYQHASSPPDLGRSDHGLADTLTYPCKQTATWNTKHELSTMVQTKTYFGKYNHKI